MKKTYKIKALPASNNFIETILTQEEIDNYKKGGYFVEELETYQSGGETVSQTWERMTGLPWSEARKLGLTDGSRQKNLDLLNKLKAGLVTLPPNAQSIVTTPRVSTTSKPTAVEKNKVLVIKNASTFKEAFSIARKQLGPNHIFEWNGRKYGTNLEGETFEPSEEVLKNAKMSSPQVKVRLNVQNQNLDSPYINKRTVKLEDDRFEKWEDIKLRNAEINKNDNANKIIEYKKNNPGTQNFVIVDKEKGLMHLYKPDGTLLFTEGFKVDVGANAGDAQTVTKYKDLNNNGITDANEIFRSNIDWSMGNKSTGAGKFYISNIDRKGYGGLPILNMMNERQYENFLETGKVANVSTSFHKGYVEDNKTKVSNGCIRCNKTTLDNLSRHLKNSSEVYILPEDDRNKFVVENNKLNFRTGSNKDFYILEDVKNKVYRRDDPNSLNSWSVATPKGKFQKITDQNKIDKLNEKAVAAGNEYYIDDYENLQKGQGINRTVSTLASYPIKLDLDEETFKNDVYQWYDFNDDEEFRNVRSFIEGLEYRKSDIMKAAKINGDVYNEIAKMAFGIFGAESNYADEKTGVTNFLKAVNKSISSGPTSSPDVISKYETYGEGSSFGRWLNEMDDVNQADRSTGYTQVRWNQLNDKEKEALRQVGITSYKDFLKPRSAATATAVILGVRYNEQLTPEEKEDMWSYLPLKWNSNPEYPDRVLNNSRYVTVLQSKDKEVTPKETIKEKPTVQKFIETVETKTKDPVYLESIVPSAESTTRVAPITPDPDTLKWLEENSGYKIKKQPQKAAQKAAQKSPLSKEQLEKIDFNIQSKYGILPGDNPIRNYEQLQDQKYIYDFSEFPSLQKGGYIDAELDDEEIESYRKAGYGIEVITDPLFKKISTEVGSNINPNWENEYFHYSPDRKKVWKTIPDRFKNFQQDIFNKYANEPQFRKVTTVWKEGGSLPKFQKTGQKYNIQKPKPIGYYQNTLEPEVSESTAVENIFKPTEEEITKNIEHLKRVGDLTKAIKEKTGVSHKQAVQNAEMIIENEMNNPQLSMQAMPTRLQGKAQEEFSKKVLDDSWTFSDYMALPLDLMSTFSSPSDETRYQRRFRRYNPNTSALDKLKESTSEALSLAPSAALNVGLTLASMPGAGTSTIAAESMLPFSTSLQKFIPKYSIPKFGKNLFKKPITPTQTLPPEPSIIKDLARMLAKQDKTDELIKLQKTAFDEGTDIANMWATGGKNKQELLNKVNDLRVQLWDLQKSYAPLNADINILKKKIWEEHLGSGTIHPNAIKDIATYNKLRDKLEALEMKKLKMQQDMWDSPEYKNIQKSLGDAYDSSLDPEFKRKVEEIYRLAGEDMPPLQWGEFNNILNMKDRSALVYMDSQHPSFKNLHPDDQQYLRDNYRKILGIRTKDKGLIPGKTITLASKPKITPEKGLFYTYTSPESIIKTAAHETGHDTQRILDWIEQIGQKYNPEMAYYTGHSDNPLAKAFKDAMVEGVNVPKGSPRSHQTWLSAQGELHSELMKARTLAVKEYMKEGYSMREAIDIVKKYEKEGNDQLFEFYLNGKGHEGLDKHFKETTDYATKKTLLQILPQVGLALGFGTAAASEYKQGGSTPKFLKKQKLLKRK